MPFVDLWRIGIPAAHLDIVPIFANPYSMPHARRKRSHRARQTWVDSGNPVRAGSARRAVNVETRTRTGLPPGLIIAGTTATP